MKLTLLLIPLLLLSSCTIDWNDEKDKKITELKGLTLSQIIHEGASIDGAHVKSDLYETTVIFKGKNIYSDNNFGGMKMVRGSDRFVQIRTDSPLHLVCEEFIQLFDLKNGSFLTIASGAESEGVLVDPAEDTAERIYTVKKVGNSCTDNSILKIYDIKQAHQIAELQTREKILLKEIVPLESSGVLLKYSQSGNTDGYSLIYNPCKDSLPEIFLSNNESWINCKGNTLP